MHRLSGHSWPKRVGSVAALTALGSTGAWVGTSAAASAASADACWATAVTVSQCGGMIALIDAAEAEGHLTVTTDPFTWANYGILIPAFEKKYGIKILDTNPNGTSADEINEINLYKHNPSLEPDILDLSVAFAQKAVTGEPGVFKGPIFEPYKLTMWDEIPNGWKDPNGYWSYDYAGVVTIGYNADVIKTPVTSWSDLLGSQFKNAVGLDNSPTSSGAGAGAVIAAAVDNGGSVSDVQAGINWFKKLKQDGNFNPIEAGGAGDGPMADKAVLATVDWSYLEQQWRVELAKSPGIDWKVVVPKGQPYASYYAMAISAYAPHPAAARLWEEYLYSPEGANIRAESGAVPSTWQAMVANSTASQSAMGAIPSFSTAPAIATPDEVSADVALIQKDWQSAVG
ncbi:MAG TPA: extracellular solute-binding protein [Acidimicrobiales bacterium]|nr:extracellular solute-binding protein [Acidimicrobiales bacterium]